MPHSSPLSTPPKIYPMNLRISFFCIAVFIFVFHRNTVLAFEIYKNDNVLVSKEGIGYYSAIGQDAYRVGAVLISEPNQTEAMILEMLNANGIKLLEDYTEWLKENIEYKKDEGDDIWTMPEETLKRKYGDCEDFAFLNAAVLNTLGFRPKVLGVNGARVLTGNLTGNHAICVFEKDGRYLYFDNEKLKTTEASSIEEFARHIFVHYNCYSISELTFENRNKNKKKIFTKYAQSS